MKMSTNLFKVLLLGATLGFAATQAASAQSWDEITAAAEKEGTVVFYHNILATGVEPVIQAFNADYPNINVEQIRLGSEAVTERFGTEFLAGRNLADVVMTNPDDDTAAGMKNGWALKWVPPEFADNFDPQYNDGDLNFTIQHSRQILIWNKTLVSDADAPKDWQDMLDPKFKGKVGMSPPWRSTAILQFVGFIQDKVGIKDFAEKLRENDVQFFDGSGGVVQAILRGDIALAEMSDLPIDGMISDGAPIGFIYPASGTTTAGKIVFAAAKAPHPNASKVLLNWLLSDKGQRALVTNNGMSVTRKGMPALANLPNTGDIPNAISGETLLTEERATEIVGQWRKVFGVQ
ncbi:ABC transporter substrate-binding protein [Shinella lacus]|uniref:Extracellular solute-binding protein n=1 Tax=Shinella lacus TaxID=2654216 RepID=A0ABT1R1D2_9HYPH|nr:extracellular solute-binding protein [Shinella lacus]MCQ4628983.1 extracellular solute-binding protein [Shinella lacus]